MNVHEISKLKALELVHVVKSRRPDADIQKMLTKIEDYIIQQKPFFYHDVRRFINAQISPKMGGVAAKNINRAVGFLKDEFGKARRNDKLK